MDPYKNLRKKMMDPAWRITKNFRSYIWWIMKKEVLYIPWNHLLLPKFLVALVIKYWKPLNDVWYSWNKWINEFYYITEWEITANKLNVFKTKQDAEKARDDAEALEKFKCLKKELDDAKEKIKGLEKENEELKNLPPVKVETLKPWKLCQCINRIDDTFKYWNR